MYDVGVSYKYVAVVAADEGLGHYVDVPHTAWWKGSLLWSCQEGRVGTGGLGRRECMDYSKAERWVGGWEAPINIHHERRGKMKYIL